MGRHTEDALLSREEDRPTVRVKNHHPRSRTGCITCKIRRVKCDEGKPSCLRCTKTGRKCDGYPRLGTLIVDHACQNRIQPTGPTSLLHFTWHSEGLRPSKLDSSPAEDLPLHEWDGTFSRIIPFELCAPIADKRSFDFFCKKTVVRWPGWYDLSFWNHLILQVCHSQPLMRHAAVAIGATHESLTLSDDRDGLSHHKQALDALALAQYNKALSIIIREGDRLPLVVILMSCLVFACLQSLQGVHTHHLTLRSGGRILKQFEDDRQKQISNPQVPDADMELITSEIRPLLERFTARFCQLMDPPHALYLSLQRRRPTAVEMPIVPLEFSTPGKARDCLENLLRWTCRNATLEPGKPVISAEMAPAVHGLSQQWINALDATVWRRLPNAENDKWSHIHWLHDANLLKAAHLLAFITIETMNDASEMKFDPHTDKFRAVVRLYRQVVEAELEKDFATTSRVSFGIDAVMADVLLMTSYRCRDPTIRREAIDLLENTNVAGGAFHGHYSATLGKVVMAIEESGLGRVTSYEEIPEANRIRILTCSHYWKTRCIRLQYTRTPYEPELGAPIQEVWYSYPGFLHHDPTPLDGATDCDPTIILGRGYVSNLQPNSLQYYKFVAPSFFFSIPKL